MECPICYEKRDLRLLACSHSVCDECIEQMFDKAERLKQFGIQCPLCASQVSWEGIYGVKTYPIYMKSDNPLVKACVRLERVSRRAIHYILQTERDNTRTLKRLGIPLPFEIAPHCFVLMEQLMHNILVNVTLESICDINTCK